MEISYATSRTFQGFRSCSPSFHDRHRRAVRRHQAFTDAIAQTSNGVLAL